MGRFINPNTNEIIEGTFFEVRSVTDLLKNKVAHLDLQFITDAGAVSVWIQYDYTDTWEDADILAKADEVLSEINLDNKSRSRQLEIEEQAVKPIVKPTKITFWQKLKLIYKILFNK
jgi:hypothetical protein